MNYLFSELESIGPNGSKTRGLNAVISMIHHYLKVHSLHEESCHLHADDCVGHDMHQALRKAEPGNYKHAVNDM